MKVAVVGAGLYGVLSSLALSSNFNIQLDLFDSCGILRGASSINQFRIHEGYHYPRSDETVKQVGEANKAFTNLFPNAVIKPRLSLYAIPREASKTSPIGFESFCDRFNLPLKVARPDWLNYNYIQKAYIVRENLYDIEKIRTTLINRIMKSSVNFIQRPFNTEMVSEYDKVVYCTYGLSPRGTAFSDDREIQLVEKVKIKLPKQLQGISLVIIDGKFTAFDPLPNEIEYSQFGSAKYTKHDIQHNVLDFDARKREFINKPLFEMVPFTNFQKLRQHAALYVPAVSKCTYEGSKFTYRIVEKNKKTDQRLSHVTKVGDREYAVLSGKVVSAAQIGKIVTEVVLDVP